jgi:16S rRNA (cytosine967-C5)-methyltransferase
MELNMLKNDFRLISLKILTDVFKTQRWAKEAIEDSIENIDIEHNDIKKVYELTYGILRNKNLIDYHLSRYIKKPVNKIELQNILRIGYYQINYMDSIPAYAAINTSVELAKKFFHPKISRFVNAVLRNIHRYKNEKVEIHAKDKIEFLSIKYSFEPWMIKFLLRYYDEQTTEKILSASNERPPIFIKVNTLKIKSADLIKELKNENILIKQEKKLKNAFVIESGNPVKSIAFENGYFYIQDLSSQFLGHLVNATENEFIIDVASAPGGKAIFCAINMKNKSKIIALELNQNRIFMMEKNFARLGLKNIEIISGDGTQDIPSLHNKADKLILDAPCSGIGVIRRHPEKKWCLKEKIISSYPELQLKLLENVKEWVKKQGFIFYSTCTINPEENEYLIKNFLKRNKNFKLIDILNKKQTLKEFKKDEFFLSLPGNSLNADGFFIAKMQKH